MTRTNIPEPDKSHSGCHGKDCILSARATACPSRNVHAEEIEPVVWNHVVGLLADPDQLLAQFDHFAATAADGSAREQAAEQQPRARLNRTARADKRLLDAHQAGVVSLVRAVRTLPAPRARAPGIGAAAREPNAPTPAAAPS